MLVSVVIPVHNRPAEVLRAVRSVLGQKNLPTGHCLEIIVVDDGSTDATPEALRTVRNPRVQLIRHETNLGVSAARNRGLAAAQGEMLALLDSDDWWLPEKTAVHLRCHQAGGWRISQTDEIWIRHGRRVNPKDKHGKPEGWFLEQALKLCLISPSCVLFDREFWDEIGPFDPLLPACEDYDLWLRTLVRHPVGLCPQKLVCKTGGHPDQLSRKIIGLDLYRLQAMDKLLRNAKMTPRQREMTLRELRAKAAIYIQGSLKHDRSDEAQRVKEWLRPWLTEMNAETPRPDVEGITRT
ncbi:Glycosyltransferase involved in cell wall bisynthesis [Desulfonatronum thiosulfatophilum]|uniref:Glycosyltransferase involved in cell wall bisynthesis n=1 Tax=Desulfonatronum thiosulfatophilum TaxID=617002 RepID=A0A1G6AA99_9BACT|nr:Glycosyltransferase involved in cell wall bisynthesis [Desulfonatronum thiosulfatophilum]